MMMAAVVVLNRDRQAPLATALLICDVEEKEESLNSLASNNLTGAGDAKTYSSNIARMSNCLNFELSNGHDH